MNDSEAFKFFLLAAEAGNSEAMLEVGDRYASGRGVDRNLELAFPWFQRAARKGEPRALYSIGECYYFGAGVPKDLNQAIYYLTQSAAFNDPYAKGLLGNIYRKGEGLEKPNYQEAFRLLSEAADQGFLDAQGNLGVMIINGEVVAGQPVSGAPMPEKADQKAAVALFKDGAEKGNALCTFFYAQSLEGGVGLAKPDTRAAREQYIKAAELGNPAAQRWCRDNRVKFTVPGR
jgi:TPR repeat protein